MKTNKKQHLDRKLKHLMYESSIFPFIHTNHHRHFQKDESLQISFHNGLTTP